MNSPTSSGPRVLHTVVRSARALISLGVICAVLLGSLSACNLRSSTNGDRAKDLYAEADALLQTEDYRGALVLLEEATQFDPTMADAWMLKGTCLFGLQRLDEALSAYDKVIELDPKYMAAWCGKGSVLTAKSDFEGTLAVLDKALEIDPDWTDAVAGRAFALMYLGRYGEALDDYERVLTIQTDAPMVLAGMAYTLAKLGRVEESLPYAQESVELKGDLWMGWWVKAQDEDFLGKAEDAIDSYRRFLEEAPPSHTSDIEYARDRLASLQGE